MNRIRSARTLATLCLTASFVVAAMAGPALVSAAPAPLQTGYGAVVGDLAPTTGAVQPTAAFNFSAAFDIWAKNTGPSNISKLFLTGLSKGAFKAVTLTQVGTNGTCVAGPGTNDVQLMCSWPNGVPRRSHDPDSGGLHHAGLGIVHAGRFRVEHLRVRQWQEQEPR